MPSRLIGGARSALAQSSGAGLLPRSSGGIPGTIYRQEPGSRLFLPPAIAGFANAGGAYYDLIRSETGLDAYFRADETSGLVAQDFAPVANPHHAAILGGVSLGQAGLLVSEGDLAYSFNGSTGRLLLGDGAAILGSAWNNGPYSFEAWFKMGASAANFSIMSMGAVGGAAGDIGIAIGPNANGRVTIVDGANRIVSSAAATYNDNGAHHVVGTKIVAANLWLLYLDGQDVTTADAFPTQSTTSGPGSGNSIGVQDNGSSPRFWFNGLIDEVAFYSVALTPTQVLTHYNTGAGIVLAGGYPYIGGGYYDAAA